MRLEAIAKDTVEIIKNGCYHLDNQQKISIGEDLNTCIAETKLYDSDTLANIQKQVISSDRPFTDTEFAVINETTLMGADRLAKSNSFAKIGILNFASAKNPGGGFLRGAQAQEESLARSSGLYASLIKYPEYYDFHRQQKNLLYSDRMIYSPNCPVFKTDQGNFLETPYLVDFITSPSPNFGEIVKKQTQDIDKIADVIYTRGAKVLSLFAAHHCDAIILGAWGCGVFRNNPAVVAQMFADLLSNNSLFYGRFKYVLFSVLDNSKNQQNLAEFQTRFT